MNRTSYVIRANKKNDEKYDLYYKRISRSITFENKNWNLFFIDLSQIRRILSVAKLFIKIYFMRFYLKKENGRTNIINWY